MRRPSRRPIGGAARSGIGCLEAGEYCFGLGEFVVTHLGAHKRSPAANTLSVHMRIRLRDAGVGKGADEAAGRATNCGARRRANQCGHEPSGRDDWTQARYSHDAETGKQPSAASDQAAN